MSQETMTEKQQHKLSSVSPVFVSDDIVRQVLDWPSMIDALRKTYSIPHSDGVSPPRVLARGPDRTWMRTLTGLDPTGRFMGVKQFGLSRDFCIEYLISLFDQQTGRVTALLDAAAITAMRTAGTTALAMDRLAPTSAATLGVLGSGTEAATHARAIHSIRPLKQLIVFSPTEARRNAFAEAFEAETGVPTRAVSHAEEAVSGQEMVVGATRTMDGKPVLHGEWLSPETVVASIGATLPDHYEVDTCAIEQAGIIIADVPEEVTEETGCFITAAREGIAFHHKVFSLNQLMLGEADKALQDCHFRLYRSVGGPLQDIAVATLAYDLAVQKGLAQSLPISFTSKQF
ncbi:ornithine cyclodeaminase family protein [Pseudomaricurvus alcaniphilus]|uniref:ornithine cyclodeaminase family protein n=1 Tax=Pseudomaricurvus alcaniphilus TaxID=1166482 RepID=UPI00140964B4|nr:ornithine cyclodeaminase family protein [Pseudomaricurvus alcaniphilus]NHN39972.1 ornithine cyclodeaminase family protein [Pseudomaricurvus alcaniphilus]